MGKIITINEICGALAMWVCRQHPFHSVEGVDSACSKLREAAEAYGFHPDILPMRQFTDCWEVEEFLWKVLNDSPETIAWNSRKNGNDSPIGFVSSYDRVAPENDFIDISALFRNVAQQAWKDVED